MNVSELKVHTQLEDKCISSTYLVSQLDDHLNILVVYINIKNKGRKIKKSHRLENVFDRNTISSENENLWKQGNHARYELIYQTWFMSLFMSSN